MYQCPDCGGNLIFDIPSQMLKCKYCNTLVDPYSVEKESDGAESNTFEATIFTCPQCGGEILSTDNASAGFCSYCGASTILTSRLSNEKRPSYLMPFLITKEDCKKLYTKSIKRSIFSPRKLSNSETIDSFRGIYMPYWKYKLDYDGPYTYSCKHNYREGDYEISDYYDVDMNLNVAYDGFTYDSSSTFYDNISSNLAPFYINEPKTFTPSMLSGFYADIADVPKEVYKPDALDAASESTYKKISCYDKLKTYAGDFSKEDKKLKAGFSSKPDDIDGVMLPIWFLSYRRKDRVAYAAINGQTGKMVTDIPIDIKRFSFFSLLLSFPIFIFLCLFFAFKPNYLLYLTMIITIISLCIYKSQISKIYKKDTNVDDKGLHQQSSSSKKSSKKIGANIIEFVFGAFLFLTFSSKLLPSETSSLFNLVPLVISIFICVSGVNYNKKNYITNNYGGYILGFVSQLISTVVIITNPVMDIYYYAGSVVSIITLLIIVITIITKLNLLSTRKLPQFNKQGGDDRA